MGTSRRTFLTAGGLGALALAAGGALYYGVGARGGQGGAARRFALDGEARAALHAIAPAILAGALPQGPERPAALASTIEGVHAAILGLPPATQEEIQDLFGLLALAPARRLLTGVSGGWEQARIEQVNGFLQDWRFHRLGLLRSAYQALHDLVLGAWYAQPANWAATGYPGPLAQLSELP